MSNTNFKRLKSAFLGAAAIMLPTAAHASTIHIYGDKIYYEGDVQLEDGDRLRAIYEEAKAAGITITTVVFRDSPGGFADGGIGMGDFIKETGLNTIFQGGCYSACAQGFSAGTDRSMAPFVDIPAFDGYDSNVLGYHGANRDEIPIPTDEQQYYFDKVVGFLGSSITPGALERIRTAHFDLEDGQGFLRYMDPAFSAVPTIFCPNYHWEEGDESACTTYPGVDIYKDGIVTKPGYATGIDDILKVHTTVSGDLNPNWGTIRDTYGIIKLEKGGVWNLNTQSNFSLNWIDGGQLNLLPGGNLFAAHELIFENGGILNLMGGELDNKGSGYAGFRPGAMLTGSGTISGDVGMFSGSIFAPDHLLLSAIGTSRIYPSEVFVSTLAVLFDGSTTYLPISNKKRDPYVTIDDVIGIDLEPDFAGPNSFYAGINRKHATLYIGSQSSVPDVRLVLNFQHGFYQPHQKIQIVKDTFDPKLPAKPAMCSDPTIVSLCDGWGEDDGRGVESDWPYIVGTYTNVVRLSDGKVIALSDGATSASFGVADDSLLTFSLVYTPYVLVNPNPDFDGRLLSRSLSLVANDPFKENIGLFGNAASGNGLGNALFAASRQAAPGNADLLGALEFSSRSAVRAQAGNLRGDAHAGQRLADAALVGSLDALSLARIGARRSGRTDTLIAPPGPDVISSLGGTIGRGAGMLASAGTDMLRYLVATNEPDGLAAAGDGAARSADDGWQGWGQVVGGLSQIDRRQGVAGLESDWAGVTIGADRSAGDGAFVVGVNLAYVSADTRTALGAYKADADVLSAAVYGGVHHPLGAFDASARYTRFSHKTKRRIAGLTGLESPSSADYDTSAFSAHAENGFVVPKTGRSSVKVLAPIVDYATSKAADFTETGGPARLGVRLDRLESLRIGAGVDLAHDFAITGGTITPHIRVTYQNERRDVNGSAAAFFPGEAAQSFAVDSQSLGRDIVQWRSGLTARATDHFSVGLEYLGEVRSGQKQQGGFVALAFRF